MRKTKSKKARAKRKPAPALATLAEWSTKAPSHEAFQELVQLLEALPAEAHEAAVTWLSSKLTNWPAEYRILPKRWWEAWCRRETPFAALARLRLLTDADCWFEGVYEPDAQSVLHVHPRPDGQQFLCGRALDPNRAGGEIELFDLNGERERTLFNSRDLYGQMYAACFNADGSRVLVAYGYDSVSLACFDTKTGSLLWRWDYSKEEIQDDSWPLSSRFGLALLSTASGPDRALVSSAVLDNAYLLEGPETVSEKKRRSVAKAKVAAKWPSLAGRGAALEQGPWVATEHEVFDLASNEKPFSCLTLTDSIHGLQVDGDVLLVTAGWSAHWYRIHRGRGTDEAQPRLELEHSDQVDPNPKWKPLGASVTRDRRLMIVIAEDSERRLWSVDRNGSTRISSSEAFPCAPSRGRQDWVFLARLNPAEYAREHEDPSLELCPDRGGVYLYSPSGEWARPSGNTVEAGKAAPANDPKLGKFLTRFRNLAHVADSSPLEFLRYATSAWKSQLNEPQDLPSGRTTYPLLAVAASIHWHEGAREKLEFLLDAGADATVRERNGANLLHVMFKYYDDHSDSLQDPAWYERVVNRVIDLGADPWAIYEDMGAEWHDRRLEPARKLARFGLLGSVEHLAELSPAILVEAAEYSQFEIVEHALDRGVPVDALDNDGRAAIHRAAEHPDDVLTRKLLAHGASPNLRVGVDPDPPSPNEVSFTPLHCASWRGHRAVVETLLRGGADPELTTDQGMTALHLAAEWGQLGVLQTLVKQGAELKKKTKRGESLDALLALKGDPRVPNSWRGSALEGRRRAREWLARYNAASPKERVELLDVQALGGWDAFVDAYEQGQRKFGDISLRGASLSLRRFEGVQADNVDVEKMFARSTQWIDCDMQWKGCCDLNGARFERCCIVGWNTAKSEKADEYIECKLFDWVVKSADYGVGNFLRSEISRFEIYCELGTCRQCQMSELIVEKGGSLNLTECTLRKSRFAPGAKLAHLDATVVEDCTLGRATIRGDCKGTRFVRSDLRGAHFEGSAVAAEFEDCRLQGATYPKGTKFSRGFDPKKHGMRAR